jgi:general secretion pathway protein J
MSERGFTLLEILVALVVMGFLMIGLSQGTRFGLQALAMQSRDIDRYGDLDAVDRTTRRLIARMDPGSATRNATLRGTASSVAFTSDLPMAASGGSASRADMLLIVDASHRLTLRWTPHLHATRFGPAPRPQEAELLQGVDRIEFGYWQTGGSNWQAAWTGRDLPALIRLRIVFPTQDPRSWPDIVAAPLLDRPAG